MLAKDVFVVTLCQLDKHTQKKKKKNVVLLLLLVCQIDYVEEFAKKPVFNFRKHRRKVCPLPQIPSEHKKNIQLGDGQKGGSNLINICSSSFTAWMCPKRDQIPFMVHPV